MNLTETRNATLQDLVPILKEQHDTKADFVIPATAIESVGGYLHVAGTSTEALAGLQTDVPGIFLPTSVCDDGISEKLAIPRAYLRKMRDTRIDLYDANVNGWIHGYGQTEGGHFAMPDIDGGSTAEPDHRKFLLRTFTSLDGPGIARALLSDSFQAFDYLDVVNVTLEALMGLRDSGHIVEVVGCDVSERRMVIKVACPDIAALVPNLLAGYRPPTEGLGWSRMTSVVERLNWLADHYSPEHLGWDRSKGEAPLAFAGFEIATSETGGGATSVCPRIVFDACANGMKIVEDIMRKVHLGGKLGEGSVQWSSETYRKNAELIRAMARDAIDTCLSQEYLDGVVARIEGKASVEIAKPEETIKVVAKQLAFSEAQTDALLADFIRGGQMTAGGVMNAVTSAAQRFDADTAYDMENVGLKALELAATV